MHQANSDSSTAHTSALRAWRLFTISSIVATACVMVTIITILAGWDKTSKHRATAEDAQAELDIAMKKVESLQATRDEQTKEMQSLRTTADSLQRSYTSASSSLIDEEATTKRIKDAIASPSALPEGGLQHLLTSNHATILVDVLQGSEIGAKSLIDKTAILKFTESEATLRGWTISPENTDPDRTLFIVNIDINRIDLKRCIATIQLKAFTFVVSRDGEKRIEVPAMSDFLIRLIALDPAEMDKVARACITELLDDLGQAMEPAPSTAEPLPDPASP